MGGVWGCIKFSPVPLRPNLLKETLHKTNVLGQFIFFANLTKITLCKVDSLAGFLAKKKEDTLVAATLPKHLVVE